MDNLRSVLFAVVVGLSLLMIVLSGLSLIYDVSYWFVKILDFPRLQYLIISFACLILFSLIKKNWNIFAIALVFGLLTSIVIHTFKIGPYFLGEKVVPEWQGENDPQSSAKILIANVLITNRNAEDLLNLIKKQDPDIVLAMEVNEWWVKELRSLKNNYPYFVEHPLDNAYGIAFYSRLPIEDPEVKFLKHSDVPSIHAKVLLGSGSTFYFHGVHPVAPFPSAEYPDNVNEKEVALAKVGALVAEEGLPSIVAGDFNDVSWSKTTRFFENQGKLRNARLGRGLYNSYNADSRFLRWPLDHFFVTKEFWLTDIERLSYIGSDHFPIMAEFVLPASP